MRNKLTRYAKVLSAMAMVVLIATVVVTLSSPADARPGRPPGPLCGWTAQWDCTLPNGSHVTVIGTQCDIAKFERKTGATCVPM